MKIDDRRDDFNVKDDFIVKVVLPEGEEETDVLTAISMTLWDLFLSLLSLGRNTYDRLRVPVGVALFGKPLPPYSHIKYRVNQWLQGGRLPPFGAVFLYSNPNRLEEGDGTMKVSWKKVEEKVGSSVGLKRRWGSGSITHSLDLYNSYWEVELKVRSPQPSKPVLKLSATKIYDIVARGVMRHKTPAIILKVNAASPQHYVILPVDIISNSEIYKLLGVDLGKTPHVEQSKSLTLSWGDDGLRVKGERPPVVALVAGTMRFLVTETDTETLKEVLKVNPLVER